MIQYTSQHQQKIKEFGNLYQMNLNPQNRWVLLAQHLPWDSLVEIYSECFSEKGRVCINPRMVIGSLIIKHKLNLSDEETLKQIEENLYMQYFLGFDAFVVNAPFSPSLFVEWRKKLGNKTFNRFSDVLLKICFSNKIKTNDENKKTDTPDSLDAPIETQIPNKGKLKLDATVADQYITYPNDLGLLNKAKK